MRDWESLVEQHLTGLALEPTERAEVIAELAAHLADTYEDLRKQGIEEEEAARRILSQVEDWQDLRRKIQAVRGKDNMMTSRVKQFWFPSLLTLLLSMGLLALIQIWGPKPSGWNGRSLWALVAPLAVIYLPWLLVLPFVGAFGAFLSQRAGGSRRAIFSSIVFPVLPYLIFFLIGVPLILIFNDRVAHNFMFIGFFVGLFAWVLAPGAALLAGGLGAQLFLSRRSDARRIAGS
jgi:hypothetical protein